MGKTRSLLQPRADQADTSALLGRMSPPAPGDRCGQLLSFASALIQKSSAQVASRGYGMGGRPQVIRVATEHQYEN
eukprot:scaffold53719_cov39-Prasinocladus_malaysianus.AAC.1